MHNLLNPSLGPYRENNDGIPTGLLDLMDNTSYAVVGTEPAINANLIGDFYIHGDTTQISYPRLGSGRKGVVSDIRQIGGFAPVASFPQIAGFVSSWDI